MKYFGEGHRNIDDVIDAQIRELIDVMRKGATEETNSWNDPLSDDNCSFEKIMLTSLNFGLTSPRQIRWFFEELLTFASEQLLVFVIDLISFWIDNQLQWIIADDWLYRQCIKVITNMTSLTAREKGLNVVSKLIRMDKIKEFAASELNMSLVLALQDTEIRNSLLIILCESEAIAQILDQRDMNCESSLESLLSSWLGEGQYDFLNEVDGRLRLAFTTTEVKTYDTEAPRRSSTRQRVQGGFK